MKKLISKSTLTVVTAALTGLCGVKAYEKYQTSKLAENTLLMQNVEALTQGEGEGDDTSCGCSGSPIYLYSELCQGTTQLRIHQDVKKLKCLLFVVFIFVRKNEM